VPPETFQHRFPCEEYLRRLPNHIKAPAPTSHLKEAKVEYAKLQYPVAWDVWSSAAQFTAFEPFRKIALNYAR